MQGTRIHIYLSAGSLLSSEAEPLEDDWMIRALLLTFYWEVQPDWKRCPWGRGLEFPPAPRFSPSFCFLGARM